MVYDLFTRRDFSYSNLSFLSFLGWIIGLIWWVWFRNLFFFLGYRGGDILRLIITWQWSNIKSSRISKHKMSYILISGIFLIVIGMNLWGLFPYVFGVRTQFVLTIRMSLLIWSSIVCSSLEFNSIAFFGHLTPTGSPVFLISILNLIELISNIIRPITLALRLGIKMTTGHILIRLISTRAVTCLFKMKMFLLIFMVLLRGYLLFEVGICFIQGFVFSLLRAQYLGEN